MADPDSQPRAPPSHPPIDESKQQIRLLSILSRAKTETQIHCQLSVFDLAQCPSYIALSYVWGPASEIDTIYLNGQPFHVRPNLFSALFHVSRHIDIARDSSEASPTGEDSLQQIYSFRSDRIASFETGLRRGTPLEYFDAGPRRWKYFWIDAICIDQSNTLERNHQVQMMSEIYKSAQFVMIWLGSACEQALTRVACKDFGQSSKERRNLRKAVLRVMSNEYWTRIWIVQECILAKEVILLSGLAFASWHDLKNAVSSKGILYKRSPLSERVVLLVDERCGYHRSQKRHDRTTCRPSSQQCSSTKLNWLTPRREGGGFYGDPIRHIWEYRNMSCHDPRDRVYALYGLLRDWQYPLCDALKVDYSLTPAQISTRLLVFTAEEATFEDVKLYHALNRALGNPPEELLNAMAARCMVPSSDFITARNGRTSKWGIDPGILSYWHETTEDYLLDASAAVEKEKLACLVYDYFSKSSGDFWMFKNTSREDVPDWYQVPDRSLNEP